MIRTALQPLRRMVIVWRVTPDEPMPILEQPTEAASGLWPEMSFCRVPRTWGSKTRIQIEGAERLNQIRRRKPYVFTGPSRLMRTHPAHAATSRSFKAQ